MGAPSNPGWKYGYVPSAGEWNNTFGGKADYPVPVDQGGTGSHSVAGANASLQQRSVVAGGTTAAASVLNWYALDTAAGAITVTLPVITATTPGDWIELLDIGYNAAVNNITIQSPDAQVYLWGAGASSAVVNISGARIVVVSDGAKWTAKVNDGALPPALTLPDGTEKVICYAGGIPKSLTTEQISQLAGAPSPYALQWGVWFNQTPGTAELLALYVVSAPYRYLANFSGSWSAPPLTNPTNPYVLNVQKYNSGTSVWDTVGHVNIATSGSVTLDTVGGAEINLVAGDRLRVVAPVAVDSTLTGFAVTLKGTPPA